MIHCDSSHSAHLTQDLLLIVCNYKNHHRFYDKYTALLFGLAGTQRYLTQFARLILLVVPRLWLPLIITQSRLLFFYIANSTLCDVNPSHSHRSSGKERLLLWFFFNYSRNLWHFPGRRIIVPTPERVNLVSYFLAPTAQYFDCFLRDWCFLQWQEKKSQCIQCLHIFRWFHWNSA